MKGQHGSFASRIALVATSACAAGTGSESTDLDLAQPHEMAPSTGMSSSSSGSTSTDTGGTGNDMVSGGTGGASSSQGGGVADPPPDLIDDLESGSGAIISHQGRVGAWFSYNDKTPSGTQYPVMGTPFTPSSQGYGSALGANTHGDGFTSWGAGMGFDLNNAGSTATTRQPYDLSGYMGVSFWARGDVVIRFMVATLDTLDGSDGGECDGICDDMHGVDISLGDVWAEHSVDFAALAQHGWGTPVAFDAAGALAMQFQTAATDFDIWIDDVRLY